MASKLPFPVLPRARATLAAGSLYAIDGGDTYIYYGQVMPNSQMAFFLYRSRSVEDLDALSAPLMSRFAVHLPSIGAALRQGKWLYLGSHDVKPELTQVPEVVQWPEGTLEVTLWKGDTIVGSTEVHDPEIQSLEVIAAYDAVQHVPGRLQADFRQDQNAWLAGGSIRRERLKKQELAARFPDQPWHALPADWVPVEGDA